MTVADVSRPYATAAADYLTTGLGIPTPLNGKHLIATGVTGDEGHATPADVDRWLDRYGSSNLGLLLDDTVVGIDVDHGYAGRDGRVKHGNDTLTGYQTLLGPLPPTVSSTSRDATHPASRIRFYRVTAADGAALRGNVDLRLEGQEHGDVEIIHRRYRYVAAWPSVHPDTGDTYEWFGPDGARLDRLPNADFDLPDLPEKWVRHLVGLAVAKRTTSYGRATRTEVDALLTEGAPSPDLQSIIVRFWNEDVHHGRGAEDESDLLGMTSRLAHLLVAGQPGSRAAVGACRAGYLRGDYNTPEYAASFDAALAGSVRFWSKWEEENAIIRGALFPDGDHAATVAASAPVDAGTAPVLASPTVADIVGGGPADAPGAQSAPEPPPTPRTAAEAEYEALTERQIAEEMQRRRVRAEAERRLSELNAVAVELPRVVRLDAFLDEPDDEPEWRVEDLLPTGGNVLLAAAQKSGKSTAAANLTRALADGTPFLGKFETKPARVVMIDDESDERQWRRRLRQQGIQRPENVQLVALRGRLATFNIIDPAIRAKWAASIAGADVVIFDCVRPALDALGLSEDKEAGLFLVALDALKHEAGVGEMIVVHHMGHDGNRSRGDSRLVDWPDVNWKIYLQKDEDGAGLDHHQPREFDAFGRMVDIPRAVLDFDPDTQHLTLATGRVGDDRLDDCCRDLIATVHGQPGITQRALFRALVGAVYTRDLVKRAAGRLELQGRIRTENGKRGSVEFYPDGLGTWTAPTAP